MDVLPVEVIQRVLSELDPGSQARFLMAVGVSTRFDYITRALKHEWPGWVHLSVSPVTSNHSSFIDVSDGHHFTGMKVAVTAGPQDMFYVQSYIEELAAGRAQYLIDSLTLWHVKAIPVVQTVSQLALTAHDPLDLDLSEFRRLREVSVSYIHRPEPSQVMVFPSTVESLTLSQCCGELQWSPKAAKKLRLISSDVFNINAVLPQVWTSLEVFQFSASGSQTKPVIPKQTHQSLALRTFVYNSLPYQSLTLAHYQTPHLRSVNVAFGSTNDPAAFLRADQWAQLENAELHGHTCIEPGLLEAMTSLKSVVLDDRFRADEDHLKERAEALGSRIEKLSYTVSFNVSELKPAFFPTGLRELRLNCGNCDLSLALPELHTLVVDCYERSTTYSPEIKLACPSLTSLKCHDVDVKHLDLSGCPRLATAGFNFCLNLDVFRIPKSVQELALACCHIDEISGWSFRGELLMISDCRLRTLEDCHFVVTKFRLDCVNLTGIHRCTLNGATEVTITTAIGDVAIDFGHTPPLALPPSVEMLRLESKHQEVVEILTPGYFSKLTNLTSLTLAGIHIAVDGPLILPESLRRIEFKNNVVSTIQWQFTGANPRVTAVTLIRCRQLDTQRLVNYSFASLGPLSQLSHLHVDRLPLLGVPDYDCDVANGIGRDDKLDWQVGVLRQHKPHQLVSVSIKGKYYHLG
ncbi:hypothetical protein DICA3_E26324 [Diutina catenulata]